MWSPFQRIIHRNLNTHGQQAAHPANTAQITLPTYRLAQALATHYQLSHWEGLIVAAATLAQCETLYSEDMQEGQVIGTVMVVDPFK